LGREKASDVGRILYPVYSHENMAEILKMVHPRRIVECPDQMMADQGRSLASRLYPEKQLSFRVRGRIR
jgi:hypothetical protein